MSLNRYSVNITANSDTPVGEKSYITMTFLFRGFLMKKLMTFHKKKMLDCSFSAVF